MAREVAMEREKFLARVRTAAATGRAYRVHARHDIPPGAGYVGAGDQPVERLAKEVILSGGQSCIVADDAAALAELARLIAHYQVKIALCWEHPLLARLGLKEFLTERQVVELNYGNLCEADPAQRRAQWLAADLGITSVWQAVAETGTLALSAGKERERVASLLPPVHVAIVDRSQILPDLFDLFAAIEREYGGDLPSNLVLITGPSKTGDLELKLTTGVHGPGHWHVIVIARE